MSLISECRYSFVEFHLSQDAEPAWGCVYDDSMEAIPASTLRRRKRVVAITLVSLVALHGLSAVVYEYGAGLFSLLVVAPAYVAMLAVPFLCWHRNKTPRDPEQMK